MSRKKEFGDFQTPDYLASEVASLVDSIFGRPSLVIEPTAGLGSFLKASIDCWGDDCRYEGYEINKEYVDKASERLGGTSPKIFHRDFFGEDWVKILNQDTSDRTLVIGNPPWVTNSELGSLGSQNLPKKSNFQGLRGLEARTGKANFDIAEWMLIKLIEALPEQGAVAMLCKTMTARKVLKHFWKTDGGREGSHLFRIDAKSAFGVAVDACLFVVTGKVSRHKIATVYTDLSLSSVSFKFGFIGGDLVSDVELEDDYIYPLLKSSDIGNCRTEPRKFVLVPQKHTGDETSSILTIAPKTWAYLNAHAHALDNRRSSIYQNRPQFSIFGIGRYSFAPWKVAISGLYKSLSFVVIPPHEGRPVMVDDTCYSIPCSTEKEATLLCDLLSSKPAMEFLKSLVFLDSKRPVTIDVLRRLSIVSVAKNTGKLDQLESCIHSGVTYEGNAQSQMQLVMEKQKKYRISSSTRTRKGARN